MVLVYKSTSGGDDRKQIALLFPQYCAVFLHACVTERLVFVSV